MKKTDKPTRTDILKKKLIPALEKSLGIVTTACKNVGVARSSFYDWYNTDEEFKKNVDSIGDIALDFAESQLHKQIQEGIPTSTIFYLKTKGKKRGYSEHQSLDITTQGKSMNENKVKIVFKKITQKDIDKVVKKLDE